ncbi:glycosyltransferase family 2 protein [Desertivirga brevis]|uniref:glycosyltransferase family 2 protein n=1 Tax=Desertivirga brevis TaxID=2810310 RepID=UPI001A95A1CD|nr:glycosyltransferase family 2 protein [Pedobacter sp. SYSU D00873]
MFQKPTCTLIIATYNWPAALDLCLKSVLMQTRLPDEVIIADDGSTGETEALVKEYQKEFPVPLIHEWQEDEGFRLAAIRNRSVSRATCDYIIQVDGDLILHPKFISDHLAVSKEKHFVCGSRVILQQEASKSVLQGANTIVNIFGNDIKNRSNGIWLPMLRNYMLLRYKKKDKLYLRGCNMAFWRRDLIAINGYDEGFKKWGREDTELAVRLLNSGIAKQALKFGGIVYHIYHTEGTGITNAENEKRLNDSILFGRKYCENGIIKKQFSNVMV